MSFHQSMTLTNIKLIKTRTGMDEGMFTFNYPEAVWPFNGDLQASVKFARGTGEAYIKTHFPLVELEVIEVV